MALDSRAPVLITGASTGIGRACALRFAAQGYRVFAGVRRSADGESIQGASQGLITPVLLEVTRRDSIDGALAAIGGVPLGGLVNNAGIAVAGPLELVPIEAWRRQFEVNVIGTVAVTQAFLPQLRAGRGRIVNIGSIAGRCALPGSGPYDASKFALEAITDALRMELDGSGMFVSLIEPGAVATPIWQKTLDEEESLRQHRAPEVFAHYARLMSKLRQQAIKSAAGAISPDEVAQAVEHAMTARKPRTRYPIGPDTRLWRLLNLLPDRWRDYLILSELRK